MRGVFALCFCVFFETQSCACFKKTFDFNGHNAPAIIDNKRLCNNFLFATFIKMSV
jgi:hypothetical protein